MNCYSHTPQAGAAASAATHSAPTIGATFKNPAPLRQRTPYTLRHAPRPLSLLGRVMFALLQR